MEWVIGWWQISVQRAFPTNEQLAQMYNAAAPCWHHHLQWLGYNRAYTKLFQKLQKAGAFDRCQDKSTVCDCGIGTAALSLALAKIVNSHLDITGVDISLEMIAKADQLLHKAGINCQIYQCDVNNLPFPDNTFDVVMSAHMLEHLENPAKGLQEMVRVLRPGKPFILVFTRPGLLYWLIRWYWGNGCFSPQKLAKLMNEAGLSDIGFYSLPWGISRWSSIACLGFRKN